MRSAGLGISPHQDRILRVKKHNTRGQHQLDLLDDLGQSIECLTLADIHHDRRALYVF